VSVAPLLSRLRALDVRLWLEGEELRCSAPAGALDGELRDELRARKPDLLRFLRMAQAAAGEAGAIVPLQPRGTRAPVFAVPPHTGDVFAYRALAQALGEDQPFFALQPPGLDGRRAPLDRVDALAAYFAREIRAAQAPGPWIIAGYCMGGTVAFELAQQLLAGGDPVAGLVFFGAPHPAFFGPLSLLRHELGNRARGWVRRARLLAAQSGRERLAYAGWRLRLHRQPVDPVLAHRASVEQATLRAVRAYEPRPFAGRVQHFVPCPTWSRRARAQAERWGAVATVQTFYGPEGCTADDMLLPAYAPGFAAQFQAVS
jgi:thioesterase domain-containing protein